SWFDPWTSPQKPVILFLMGNPEEQRILLDSMLAEGTEDELAAAARGLVTVRDGEGASYLLTQLKVRHGDIPQLSQWIQTNTTHWDQCSQSLAVIDRLSHQHPDTYWQEQLTKVFRACPLRAEA